MSTVPTGIVAHMFPTCATTSNVTAGDNRVGWVSAGSGRGTSDILWSCFSILLVCTYKCIHFNVPSIHESEARWHSWGIVFWPGARLWSKWAHNVRWMVGIILAPELGIAIAMHQNLQARKGLKLLRMDKPRETGPQDFESKNDKSKKIGSTDVESTNDQVKVLGVGRDELTKAYAFFANMGGFIAKICVLSRSQQSITSSGEPVDTSSIPKTSQELICEIKKCEDLGQLILAAPLLSLFPLSVFI
jgi:hypothetical protein